MTEHRLRLNDEQLSFLILRLNELLESDKELVCFYRNMKENTVDEYPRERHEKASNALHEVTCKLEGTKDLIRCFSSVVNGGKPRTTIVGRMACAMALKQSLRVEPQDVPHTPV